MDCLFSASHCAKHIASMNSLLGRINCGHPLLKNKAICCISILGMSPILNWQSKNMISSSSYWVHWENNISASCYPGEKAGKYLAVMVKKITNTLQLYVPFVYFLQLPCRKYVYPSNWEGVHQQLYQMESMGSSNYNRLDWVNGYFISTS